MNDIADLATFAAVLMGHRLGVERADDLAHPQRRWQCVVPECARVVVACGCTIYGSAVDERCPGPGGVAHGNCPAWAWMRVTCQRCGRRYVCTPTDDYYCAAEGDHCCHGCLISAAGLDPAKTVTFIEGGAR